MKRAKRFLSLFLAFCMVVGMAPAVLAAESGLPFRDVKATDWYYSAVSYAYENGMMGGTGGDAFSPDAATTRGMIVTILHRLEGTPAAEGTAFSDVAAGAYYANAAAKQAVATFPYLLGSDVMRDLLLQELGTSGINGSISASTISGTNFMVLTVTQ